jgi:hypothetical protein
MSVTPAMRSSFDQTILKGAVDPLDPAFGLAGVSADDLDIQLRQRAAELRHALTTLGVGLGDAEHRVLVRVECGRAPVRLKVAPKRVEVGGSALAADKPQLHQLARRIIDEH